MKKNHDTLAIIPARKGSKSVVFKNKRSFSGKALVCYTIEAALESDMVDIMVSSDDDDIIKIAEQYGIISEYKRPEEVSGDSSTMDSVLLDVFDFLSREEKISYDYGMTLQPTSPFRTGLDIVNALILKKENPSKSVIGVSEMLHHPTECIHELTNGAASEWEYLVTPNGAKRRQDYSGKYWFINGAIYCYNVSQLLQKRGFEWDGSLTYKMSIENSIDIDTEMDFLMAEALMRYIKQKKVFPS